MRTSPVESSRVESIDLTIPAESPVTNMFSHANMDRIGMGSAFDSALGEWLILNRQVALNTFSSSEQHNRESGSVERKRNETKRKEKNWIWEWIDANRRDWQRGR